MGKLFPYMYDQQAHADRKQYFCAALQSIIARDGINGPPAVRQAWDIADEAVAQSHERPGLKAYLKERLNLE
jgi:hypothetical protein